MTMLTRFLDEIDARRAKVTSAPQICASCGEVGEFDPFRAAFHPEHMELLADHFGGEVCLDCADSFAACPTCHEVSDERSVKFGGPCEDCQSRGVL